MNNNNKKNNYINNIEKNYVLSKNKNMTAVSAILVCLFIFTAIFFCSCSASENIITRDLAVKESQGAGENFKEDQDQTEGSQQDTDTGTDQEDVSGSQNQDLDTSLLSKNILTVGSDTTFPPFSFKENGSIAGFDIDIVKEIMTRINKEINIVSVEYDPEYKKLKEKEIDLFISAVCCDDKKESDVDFTKPYFTMKFLLMVPFGSEIEEKENLIGEKIGILDSNKGCIEEEYLLDYEVTYYDDIVKMLDSLKNREIEGILVNLPLAVNILKENKDMYNILEETGSSREFVIVLGNNSALKEKINTAIDEIYADGTYEEIYNTWFDYNGF